MNPMQTVLDAAARGDVDSLRSLLQSSSPDQVRADCDPNELSALHLAAAGGHVDAMRFLLSPEVGSDSNCTRINIFAPLHSAAMQGHTAACELLLDSGANVNMQTEPQGYAPLHSASFGGHVETVRLLIARGGDTSLRNYRDEQPIDTAKRQNQGDVIAAITELTA